MYSFSFPFHKNRTRDAKPILCIRLVMSHADCSWQWWAFYVVFGLWIRVHHYYYFYVCHLMDLFAFILKICWSRFDETANTYPNISWNRLFNIVIMVVCVLEGMEYKEFHFAGSLITLISHDSLSPHFLFPVLPGLLDPLSRPLRYAFFKLLLVSYNCGGKIETYYDTVGSQKDTFIQRLVLFALLPPPFLSILLSYTNIERSIGVRECRLKKNTNRKWSRLVYQGL